MTDEQAILQLLAQYCQYMDDQQIEEFVDLFIADGTQERRGDVFRGREQIGQFALGVETPGGILETPREHGKHIFLNPIVKVEGDTATAVSDFIYLRPPDADGKLNIANTGRYYDKFVRQPDRWRFASRTVRT